jgi:hypothetical protein
MLTCLLALALAAELSPRQAAEIQHEHDKAQAQVAAKYGNRKSSELSSEERRQMVRDQAEAERKVLADHDVSPGAWVRNQALRTPADRAEVKREQEALAAKEKEQQQVLDATKRQEEAEGSAVSVQRGFSEENPVMVEEKKGGPVTVEHGLPPEAQEETALVNEQDRLEGVGAAKGEKPAKPAGAHHDRQGASGGRR